MSQDQLVPRVDAEATGELERMLNGLPDLLVEGDRDKWLPVTGGRRSGKSNLAIFNAIWVDPDFDVETQIAYTAPDYVDICLGLRKGKAAILDEPVAGLLSFDANTGENKGLYRAATLIGERNLFHQILIPSEKRITKAFREDYTPDDLHVVERGLWQLRTIADIERHSIVDPPRVRDWGDFPQLPSKIESKYKKRKTEFVQSHRDTRGYDELRMLERQMDERLAPVLRRHRVELRPDPVHVA